MLGDYHVHTTLSDGNLTPKEAIESAISFGLNEIGISDHYFTKKDKIHCINDREIDGYIQTLQIYIFLERNLKISNWFTPRAICLLKI